MRISGTYPHTSVASQIASVTSPLSRDLCDFRLHVSIGVPIGIESGSPYRDRQTFPIVQPRDAGYARRWVLMRKTLPRRTGCE